MSAFALFMLISGLPWAKSWSAYLTAVRSVVEGPVGPPDWMAPGRHAGHGGMRMKPPPVDLAALDRLVPLAAAQHLAPPATLAPPARPGAPWLARSEAQDRTAQATIAFDASGRVLGRRDFAGKPLIDRIVNTGASIHEGQLFGLANQLLGLFTALGLFTVAVSALVLWWRRRPEGTLGAPAPRRQSALAAGFFVLVAVLGILLPLFAVSAILVLSAERYLLRRNTTMARWLGLQAATARS